MRYDDEIRDVITASLPVDWDVLEKDDPRFPAAAEEGRHPHAAVYKPDDGVLLAWGLSPDGPGVAEQSWDLRDLEIVRQAVEVRQDSEVAARWSVLLADGYRCYLPEHDPDPEQPGGWTVKRSELALAKLLQNLTGLNWSVDEYLRGHTRARIVNG